MLAFFQNSDQVKCPKRSTFFRTMRKNLSQMHFRTHFLKIHYSLKRNFRTFDRNSYYFFGHFKKNLCLCPIKFRKNKLVCMTQVVNKLAYILRPPFHFPTVFDRSLNSAAALSSKIQGLHVVLLIPVLVISVWSITIQAYMQLTLIEHEVSQTKRQTKLTDFFLKSL